MPKLLWANFHCLLDRSSGASLAVREQLAALARRGFDIRVLGATAFDHPSGAVAFGDHREEIRERVGAFATVSDGVLDHELLVTKFEARGEILAAEETQWFDRFIAILDSDRPDLVYYYGGLPFDFLIAGAARDRGIPVAFYLANENYHGSRWHRDVDLVVTDTAATARLYNRRDSLDVASIGMFVDPDTVIAANKAWKRLLFVSPAFEKGAAIVARLAILMETKRPDIVFEVVQGRGDWAAALCHAFTLHGEEPRELANVILTAGTADMRPVYRRARLLLAPSLCWESGGRVATEALLNGIPPIVSTHGGMPDMVGEGGVRLDLPDEVRKAPYRGLPSDEALAQLIEAIENLYDDPQAYAALSQRAIAAAREIHSLEREADGLADLFRNLIGEGAAEDGLAAQ